MNNPFTKFIDRFRTPAPPAALLRPPIDVTFTGNPQESYGIGGIQPSISSHPIISVDDMQPSASVWSQGTTNFNGNKFFGGLGQPTTIWTDYWALRLHSARLFKENLYARGLIRRLVTNEITTGLSLEATPIASILGMDEDKLNEWSEQVENLFQIYADNKNICDYKEQHTFGELQLIKRVEALVTGDVLVVQRQSRKMHLPATQLIPGNRVQTPMAPNPRKGNKIIHGIELDSRGRHVAYWIVQDDNTSKRLPAVGERSGRRIAWLVYGTDKRIDEVRGEPIFSLMMQSLKEIDRYRDSAQRKAVINSILAMFIEKGENKMGTKPVTGGATRRDQVDLSNPDGTTRKFNIADQIPGLVLEELQQGETPHAFNSVGTDINFPTFEAAIVYTIAWANEIPPEVLTLSFASNYSASRAAVNEFKMYLDKSRKQRANEFTKPVYEGWLLSSVLINKIQAPGLVEAWRDPAQYDTWGAWVSSDWAGAIKPSVDLKKEVSAYAIMVKEGFITIGRATRELTGMKFSQVAKQLKKENEQRAEALRPLFELEKEFGVKLVDPLEGPTASDNIIEEAVERTLAVIEGGN